MNSGFRLWKKIRINSHNTNTPPKLPQIIKDFLGTISVLVSISEIVSVFIAASQRIAEIRSEGSDTFGATLVKAEAGPMVASTGM